MTSVTRGGRPSPGDPNHAALPQRRGKALVFLLEGLTSLATSYYFYFFFFYLRAEFGFSSAANLAASSLHGLVYMCCVGFAGRWDQRYGYFRALRFGFTLMLVCMLFGALTRSLLIQLCLLAAWTFGICFIWPVLEAVVTEKEPPAKLAPRVGLYNLVWAGTSALTYFCGGAVFERFGPLSLFLLPALIHAGQLALLFLLDRRGADPWSPPVAFESGTAEESNPVRDRRQRFLALARLANPFAYLAIYAAIPVMPHLAAKFRLSLAEAGVFGSIWFFGRLGAFVWLWRWQGWHYRYGILLGAVIGMIAGLALIFLAGSLGLAILAQLLFGVAVGLIYSSSLFYSMDLGERKGEHGGLHEAAIGVGIFSGSAIGALSGFFFPGNLEATVWPVMAILGGGLAALIWRRPDE